MRRRIFTIAVAVLAVAFAVAIFFFNPEKSVWMPKCPVHLITGLQCPSCGNTRAVHQLMHGHFHQAFMYNPYNVIALPLAAIIIWLYTFAPHSKERKWGSFFVTIYLITYVVWFVLRNILKI